MYHKERRDSILPKSTTESSLGIEDSSRASKERCQHVGFFSYPSSPVGQTDYPADTYLDVPITSIRSRRCSLKQRHPKKCPLYCEPNFSGVAVSMQFKIDSDNMSRLELKPSFSFTPKRKASRIPDHSQAKVHRSTRMSGSKAPVKRVGSNGKQCASCGTKRTPLWRDADDGTPLCNACGIRFRKYRVKCTKCWYVPKKQDKSCAECTKCKAKGFTMIRYKCTK